METQKEIFYSNWVRDREGEIKKQGQGNGQRETQMEIFKSDRLQETQEIIKKWEQG